MTDRRVIPVLLDDEQRDDLHEAAHIARASRKHSADDKLDEATFTLTEAPALPYSELVEKVAGAAWDRYKPNGYELTFHELPGDAREEFLDDAREYLAAIFGGSE